MIPENIMWFVASTIISTIISAVVSTGFTKIFIERSQKKRDHSQILNETSLKEWSDKIDEIFKRGAGGIATEYSHEEQKIVPIELGNIDLVPHHQSLGSHMKSGYQEEWELWKELRHDVERFNKGRSSLLEKLRQTFLRDAGDINFHEYYPQPAKKQPDNYVRPDKIAERILGEVEQRLMERDEWWGGGPTIYFFVQNDTKVHRLTIFDSGELINDVDLSNVEFCKEFILSKVEDPEVIERAEYLLKIDEGIKTKRENFEEKLRKIISDIELGENIKGKCDVCSNW